MRADMSIFGVKQAEPRTTVSCVGGVDELTNHEWNSFLGSLRPTKSGYETPEGCVYEVTDDVLGNGGESTVYVCRKVSGNQCSVKAFAIKEIHDGVMTDERYSLKLLKKSPIVDTVPAADVTDMSRQRKVYRIAMPMFDGTIDDLYKNGVFSKPQTLHVMKQTIKICNDLKNAGLSYTDMKPQNILYYACGTPDTDSTVPITIRLGDLGSIGEINSKYQSSTTLPPPDISYSPTTAEAFMLWSCGATMCILLCHGYGLSNDEIYRMTSPLYWNNIQESEEPKSEQRKQLVGIAQGIFKDRGYSRELCERFMGTETEMTHSTFNDVLVMLEDLESECP